MNLRKLYTIIKNRQKELPKNSYVSSLLKKGKDAILQKLGEEAIEVILAAKQSKQRKISELSDLLFFITMFMVSEQLTFREIEKELEKRNKKITSFQENQNARNVFQVDEQL